MSEIKLKQITLILFIITFIGCICISSWLIYEFRHPYLCNYLYIDKNGDNGEAKQCSTGFSGGKYCRLSVKQIITVKDYKKVCKRR